MTTKENQIEQLSEYINDFVTDKLDGAGLYITDDEMLQEEIDLIAEDTEFEYLRNEIFKQDKVENLLKAISNIESLLNSDFDLLNQWKDEIQAVLDAKKELVEND